MFFDMKHHQHWYGFKIAIPRAINRYHKQGNIGIQFVHGGASIQELITPVLVAVKRCESNSNLQEDW
jgi:hypothetical protein